MSTLIIGLASPAPQCGKSTVAAMLLDLVGDGVELPFADAPKAMIRRFLQAAGLREDEIHLYENTGKELVIPQIGVSIRQLWQTLAHEWGRGCIAPDIWIRVWGMSAENLINDGCELIVVPDVRYRNELKAIHEAGGQAWWVDRIEAVKPAPARTMAHASEGELRWQDCDRRIDNNGTLLQLNVKVQGLFDAMQYACSE